MGTWLRSSGRRLLTAVAAWVALATIQPAPSAASEIQRIPAMNFEWPETGSKGPARFMVRPASLDEQAAIRERLAQSNAMLASGLGLSALGAVEAAALGGMFAGGLVAGAVVLAPLSLGLYVHDKTVANHIREALDVGAFLDEIRAGLPADPPAAATALEVEVTILDFGLVPRDQAAASPLDPICLVADARIVVRQSNEPLYDQLIHLQPYLRSAGAPAPICRTYDVWGKREAAPLVAARRDLARSVSAMVLSRLQPIVGSN